MKKNRWQNNFNRALIFDLYIKPILSAAITFFIAVMVGKWLTKDLISAPLAVLAVILYYLYFLDAKIDLLKRTLDEKAKYRNARYLWVESQPEKES
ncbi:MAG: hypothetical protein ACE5HS_11270 [bacterium]